MTSGHVAFWATYAGVAAVAAGFLTSSFSAFTAARSARLRMRQSQATELHRLRQAARIRHAEGPERGKILV